MLSSFAPLCSLPMLPLHPIPTTGAQPWPNFPSPASHPLLSRPSASSPTSNNHPQTSQTPPSAKLIKRLVLSNEGRRKLNTRPDRDFYSHPRFVTHVDDNFIAAVTDLYRERLSPGWEVMDLMSSWVSHLPPEVKYKRVAGHGLNAQELAKNPRLDHFFVKDLNDDQQLQQESCSFDAVICAVGVQYLQFPEKVFAEVFRVLKPGGVFIVSFSNRMFYEKAVGAWRDGTAYGRVQLVVQYFQCIDGFTRPEVVRKLAGNADNSLLGGLMRLLGLSGSDPFYAVIAYRDFKPVLETTE